MSTVIGKNIRLMDGLKIQIEPSTKVPGRLMPVGLPNEA
jgi:hypothetical protein